MFNPYYGANPYYNPYQQQMPPAVPDNLAQMRNQQMQTAPQQQIPPQQQNQHQSTDERIWVLGEAAAKSFLILPGNTVPLWDSEQQVIYLKSVNAAGVPTMTKLTYTIDNDAPAPINAQDYITRSEFEERLRAILNNSENKGDTADV